MGVRCVGICKPDVKHRCDDYDDHLRREEVCFEEAMEEDGYAEPVW
jgi:hypothetical protein